MSKKIFFATSNKNKINEVKKILGQNFTICSAKSPEFEIQAIEISEVIRHKIIESYKINQYPIICEDTGLYIFNDFKKFPGALMKFYHQCLGLENICKHNGNYPGLSETIVGYHDSKDIHYFVGQTKGYISTSPKGDYGFGYDPIFIPSENNPNKLTYAEMDLKEKNQHSARNKAFLKFKDYIINQN